MTGDDTATILIVDDRDENVLALEVMLSLPGVEIVTADGDIVWLGGKTRDAYGYDLLGAFIGSEGTCGIATKIYVRLTPIPAGSKTSSR